MFPTTSPNMGVFQGILTERVRTADSAVRSNWDARETCGITPVTWNALLALVWLSSRNSCSDWCNCSPSSHESGNVQQPHIRSGVVRLVAPRWFYLGTGGLISCHLYKCKERTRHFSAVSLPETFRAKSLERAKRQRPLKNQEKLSKPA